MTGHGPYQTERQAAGTPTVRAVYAAFGERWLRTPGTTRSSRFLVS